jgi:hypothetical protein
MLQTSRLERSPNARTRAIRSDAQIARGRRKGIQGVLSHGWCNKCKRPAEAPTYSYARFNEKKPKQIAKGGLEMPSATNDRIERLNEMVRERVKLQKRWKTMKTPLAEGFRIHYNFAGPTKR